MTGSSSTVRPTVALLIPPARRPEVLTDAALEELRGFADLREATGDTAAISEQLTNLLGSADVALTGWGSPSLSDQTLAAAPRLRLIAHTAGSVKRLVHPSIFDRDVTICHAAGIIADAVAEMTVLYALMGLRRVHEMSAAMKSGANWREAMFAGPRLLGARTVGIVGAGYVGRKVIRLLQGFGPRILVYDPYLSLSDAAKLEVEPVGLDDLFAQSDVVSIHAPVTPETRHLIGSPALSKLRDGSVFINCSRSSVVDSGALLAQLQTGRFWAALDVFDEEPLPASSPLRSLANVVVTPHQAGHTVDTHRRQGQEMVEEIRRFFNGETLRYQIRPEAFALLA